MPYTDKAKRFIAICANAPGKAKKKCMPKATAKKMLRHGTKRGR